MDYETVCRLRLPIIFVVINNNGIYAGIDRETWSATATDALPSTSLLPDARYEKLAEAFGGSGYLVRKPGMTSTDIMA